MYLFFSQVYMNSEYVLMDPRPLDAFKDSTFSNFKKLDVYKALYKSIDTCKVEEACYWMTECICSGYCQDILEKCMIHASKVIHINSPQLPMFLLRRYNTFLQSINHISSKQRDLLIHIRNTQEVRNNLIDVVVTLALAPKHKRYDAYPKINIDKDFHFQVIKEKMNATMQVVPTHIMRFSDPEELRIIMNEILFNLKNKHGGYEKVCYWIAWLVQWEKRNKVRKETYEIEERPIQGVSPKYCKDVIWLVWELVFEECSVRDPTIRQVIKDPIQALFQLFRNSYSCGKRGSRLPYLYHAVAYLTLPLPTKVSVRPRPDIFIQTQCNINLLFKGKKVNEVTHYVAPPKAPKKLTGPEKEIMQSRLQDMTLLENY